MFENLVGNFFTYNLPYVQSRCNHIQYNSIKLHLANNFLPTIWVRHNGTSLSIETRTADELVKIFHKPLLTVAEQTEVTK